MAIQVNGTTVIDNSRALTNISSVDSSVVSAMSSAGVGGATSLITNWTNIPTTTNFTLSLSSSYDIIRIYFNLVGTDNQATYLDLFFRLQYSGGTETGYDYVFGVDYGSSGQSTTEDKVQYGTSSGSGSTYPTRATGVIEFAWHGDSNRVTQFRSSFVDTFNYNGNINYSNIKNGIIYSHSAIRAHTGVNFYTASTNVNYSGGQYLVMGVNL